MPDPITPRAQDDLDEVSYELYSGLENLLDTLTRELYGITATPLDLADQPPAVQRDYRLARIAAATIITDQLALGNMSHAYAAGRVEGAPATYTALGAAAGITKEGARGRFPGAVPDAKPGRPRNPQATVRLVGGPAEWAGAELEYDQADVHELPLGEVGTYLITPGEQIPQDMPADARAHYAPQDEDTRTTWVFQGWVEG